jgi:hypothetical protein
MGQLGFFDLSRRYAIGAMIGWQSLRPKLKAAPRIGNGRQPFLTEHAACHNSAKSSALSGFNLASSSSGGLALALSANLSPFRPIQTPALAASLLSVTALKIRPSKYRHRHPNYRRVRAHRRFVGFHPLHR